VSYSTDPFESKGEMWNAGSVHQRLNALKYLLFKCAGFKTLYTLSRHARTACCLNSLRVEPFQIHAIQLLVFSFYILQLRDSTFWRRGKEDIYSWNPCAVLHYAQIRGRMIGPFSSANLEII
jgi:hypothetical protein